MTTSTPTYELSPLAAPAAERRAARAWWVWFVCLLGFSLVVGASMMKAPASAIPIAWLLFLICVALIFYQPRYGVYLILFLSLLGDMLLMPEYPFNKNFSSAESVLYVNGSLIVSPLEVCLVLTLVSWLGRGVTQRRLGFHVTPLTWPALVYGAFVVFGLAWGIGRGGSLNIALWEARSILYLPLMLVLTSNLLEKREHLSNLMWAAMLAIFIEALVGDWFVIVTNGGDLGTMEAIAEHSLSIHENTLFVFIAAAWLYRASYPKRLLLTSMAPFVLLTFASNQRRASYISLILALALVAVALFKENRRLFFAIIPPIALLGVVYLGVFWNSSGSIAQPARAVRSVIAPVKDGRDDRSNVYRDIENLNTEFTIHQMPLTGVGFGQKFYMVVPLPDISFFVWYEYITHNSIMWIWMKTGGGGFFTMVFLVGMALMTGARAVWRMPGGDMAAIALTATLYLVMHFVYAYVDMSWETQSMIYVGAMMGVIGSMERIVGVPVPVRRKRWPWQPEPVPEPGLVPDTPASLQPQEA